MSDEMFFVTPEIRARYLSRRESDIVSLRDAIEAGNFQLIGKLGHDWKGNGETYGFPQFSEWGKNLEVAAKEKRPDSIRAIVEEVAKFLASQNK